MRGIVRRLDELAALGVDALWLSPMYPSPLADGGYDIADFTGVDPPLGTLDDIASWSPRPHRRGHRGSCSTSSRTTPRSSTRGSASTPTGTSGRSARRTTGGRRSAGRRGRATSAPAAGTCTRSTPSSPTSTGATPRSCAAMQDVVRTWLGRGVDGFRARRDRLPRQAPRPARRPARDRRRRRSPSRPSVAALEHAPLAQLDAGAADGARRRCARRPATRSWSARCTGRRPSSGRTSTHLDSAFVFELLFAPWRADAWAAVIERAARLGRTAWMLSNHDFSRVGSRIGEAQPARRGDAAADAARTGVPLPGRRDRPARRARRRPARSTATAATAPATRCSGTPARSGGFTTGTPWLAGRRPGRRNVADQRADPASLWSTPPRADRPAAEARRRARAGRGGGRRPARLPPRRRARRR